MSLKANLQGFIDPGVDCSVEPSRTKQSFKDECDINVLMARVEAAGGVLDQGMVEARQAAFGDFSEGLDYFECQNRILAAQEAFMTLPARVRERFGNEPAEVVEFLSDAKNEAEAVELGLVKGEVKRVEGGAAAPVVSPPGGGTGGVAQ